jgi:hypothetical protein
MEDRSGWTFQHVELADYEKLVETATTYPQPGVDTILEKLYGDDTSWPCPFCPEHRPSSALAKVDLDEDAVPKRFDEFTHEVKKTFSTLKFLGDITQGMFDKALSAMLPTAAEDVSAIAYRCSLHGEFYVRFLLGEGDPFLVFVVDDNQMQKRRARHMVCPGLTRDVDPSGEVVNIELCMRLLDRQGTSAVTGDAGEYVCEIHGDQTAAVEPGYSGPLIVLTRSIGR